MTTYVFLCTNRRCPERGTGREVETTYSPADIRRATGSPAQCGVCGAILRLVRIQTDVVEAEPRVDHAIEEEDD